MTDELTPSGLPKHEPVREWTHDGRDCKVAILRGGPQGHYCGYARTTLTGGFTDYQAQIDVHGGPTYGIDDEGWIGFNCGRPTDMCVDEDGERLAGANPDDVSAAHFPPIDEVPQSQIWTLEGVVDEVESLAEQLDAIEADD